MTMPRAIRVLLPDRLGRGRPRDANVIITDVDGGPGQIGDRIVEPWREAIVLAIATPDTFAARLGNKCAKLRIGHNVDPRERCLRAGTQIDNKFLSVISEAAEAVEIFQLHKGQRCGGFFAELLAR